MKWYAELRDQLGEEGLIVDPPRLRQYLTVVNSDTIGVPAAPTDFVVARPKSTSEVVETVKFARTKRVPIVPRGAGTSREGACFPLPRSVVVEFSRMSKLVSVDAENMFVTAEPGIELGLLETELNRRGLSLGHGPDHASLGGSIGTNSLGQGSNRSGDMRSFVADLEVVTGTASLIHTGRQVWRNNTGLSITQLMIGSEGTLGLITAATLKAGPKPEAVVKRVYAFELGLEPVVALARRIEQAFLPDSNRVDDEARNEGGACSIRVTLKGKAEVVDLQARLCDELATRHGGVTLSEDMASNLIRQRSAKAYEMAIHPSEIRSIPEEPALKFSDWKDGVATWKELCSKHGVRYLGCQLNMSYPGVITFYAGNLVDSRERSERYEVMMDEFYSHVIGKGGSFSATHGVGSRLRRYMSQQYPQEYLRELSEIKRAFDPLNILNPGLASSGPDT